MRRLSLRRGAMARYDVHHGPNMTPMVDVVMVILVFFMASATMLGPEWFLPSRITRTASGSAATGTRIEIRVIVVEGAKVAFEYDGNTLSRQQVGDMLQSQVNTLDRSSISVIVRPSLEVPYDIVVELHELCARLGLSQVGIADPVGPQAPPAEPIAPVEK